MTRHVDHQDHTVRFTHRLELDRRRINEIVENAFDQNLTDDILAAAPADPPDVPPRPARRGWRSWLRVGHTATATILVVGSLGAASLVAAVVSDDPPPPGTLPASPSPASAPDTDETTITANATSTPPVRGATDPQASASASEDPDTGADTRRPTRGAGTAVGAGLAETGTPVFPGDFADPFVLYVDEGYVAYATNTSTQNVPMLRATVDGVEPIGDALPELPEWSSPGYVWAPAVLERAGTYILYFTTRHADSGRMCIGLATADSPTGPFTDTSSEPFICDLAGGGSIDASPFVDRDETVWLQWKNDGNCCGIDTHIYTNPLTDDGLTLAGPAVSLVHNTEQWEGNVVEGPTMIEADGIYHLLYSANRWDTADYAIGHAICDSPAGPCVKDTDPWLTSHLGAAGPGGPEIFTAPGQETALLAFHAWEDTAVGYDTGVRSLHVTPLRLEGTDLTAPRLERES